MECRIVGVLSRVVGQDEVLPVIKFWAGVCSVSTKDSPCRKGPYPSDKRDPYEPVYPVTVETEK